MADVLETARSVRVDAGAPWRWLGAGLSDTMKEPTIALGYGIIIAGAGALLTFGLAQVGYAQAAPAAVAAFMLIGPLMAVGLYEISRRLRAGETINWGDVIFVKTESPSQIAFIGVIVLIAFLAWSRLAMLLFALFAAGENLQGGDFVQFALGTQGGLTMLAVGAAIGGVIAFGIFLLTALTIPMLMDKPVDAVTAVRANVRVFQNNPRAMLLWAGIVVGVIALGAAAFGVGLALAFPVLGCATWRAYADVFRGESPIAGQEKTVGAL